MTQAKDFIVVEFDLHARKCKKITLEIFNERRKEEFKRGHLFKYLVLMGVFETNKEADNFIAEFNDIDLLVNTILKEDNPFFDDLGNMEYRGPSSHCKACQDEAAGIKHIQAPIHTCRKRKL
jgi:hypothetical protein